MPLADDAAADADMHTLIAEATLIYADRAGC